MVMALGNYRPGAPRFALWASRGAAARKAEACPAQLERSESEDGLAQVKTGCRKFSDSTVKELAPASSPGIVVRRTASLPLADDRAIQYSRMVASIRDFAASWMPRLKRGMTVEERDYAFPRQMRPSFAHNPARLENQGRRESRVPDAPAAARGVVVSTRVSHHRSTGIRPSLRNGFNGLLRALPGDRAFLPPSSARIFASTNLTPASGCQDHTTSPSACNVIRLLTCRVHRIPRPTSVTIAKRPLCGTGRREPCR